MWPGHTIVKSNTVIWFLTKYICICFISCQTEYFHTTIARTAHKRLSLEQFVTALTCSHLRFVRQVFHLHILKSEKIRDSNFMIKKKRKGQAEVILLTHCWLTPKVSQHTCYDKTPESREITRSQTHSPSKDAHRVWPSSPAVTCTSWVNECMRKRVTFTPQLVSQRRKHSSVRCRGKTYLFRMKWESRPSLVSVLQDGFLVSEWETCDNSVYERKQTVEKSEKKNSF